VLTLTIKDAGLLYTNSIAACTIWKGHAALMCHNLCQHPLELWHDQVDDDMQVFILPTIRINNGQYRGKLAYAEVLQAICAGFSYGAEPSVCMQEDTCREGSQPDTDCKAK
jgi:hypothetical protein